MTSGKKKEFNDFHAVLQTLINWVWSMWQPNYDSTHWFDKCCFQSSNLVLWPVPSWAFDSRNTHIHRTGCGLTESSFTARTPTPAIMHPLDGTSCQSRCVHAPTHNGLYRLFYFKWDHVVIYKTLSIMTSWNHWERKILFWMQNIPGNCSVVPSSRKHSIWCGWNLMARLKKV